MGLVFVFFKPGVKPVYDYQELGSLVESNVNKDIMWNSTRIPVFVKPIQFNISNNKLTTNQNYEIMLKAINSNFDITNINRVDSVDGILLMTKVPLLGICARLNFTSQAYPRALIFFNSDIPSGTIACSPLTPQKTACSKEELDNEQTDGDFNETLDISKKCGAMYKVGSPETLVGLNLSAINYENKKYADLKVAWGFPTDKDFKVVIYSDKSTACKNFNVAKNTTNCFINSVEPPTTANVFVQESNIYALDSNGTLTPYMMNIRVW